MIIWLNGGFGAGKTTIAAALVDALPGARRFDPESLGAVLQRLTRVGDYQDLALWRRLVVRRLRGRHGPVVVPMTLVRPEYREEILGGLRRGGTRVVHVVLAVPKAELRARIEADQADPEAASWRLAHLDAAGSLAGLADREPDTIEVSNSGRTPAEVVAEIIARCDLAVR